MKKYLSSVETLHATSPATSSATFLAIFFISSLMFSCNTYHIKCVDSDGVFVEKPFRRKPENRYTKDNRIYKAHNKYILSYKYINGGKEYFYAQDSLTDKNWHFIRVDSVNKSAVDEVEMCIKPDLDVFNDRSFEYRQTVIEYKHESIGGELYCSESTGLIENRKNIWLHPPRSNLFGILELNPFPYIQKPYKVGNKWEWDLVIGSIWGDRRWCEWKGKINNSYNYEIASESKISTSYYKNIECYVIKSTAESRLGKTYLTSYFNRKLGFVKLDYTNIDGSKIIIEIKKI